MGKGQLFIKYFKFMLNQKKEFIEIMLNPKKMNLYKKIKKVKR